MKWTWKPIFIRRQNFDNNLIAIRKINAPLTLNKPVYDKMCMVELSRVSMYEFHYDCMKKKYGNKSRLLFTDNDRLVYEIETENVSREFSKNKEMFDFTVCFSKPKYYNDSTALLVSKMKDEMGG